MCCSTSKACSDTYGSGWYGTYNECVGDQGSYCYTGCSVTCSGYADCTANATCSYDTSYQYSGTQYYGGSCNASGVCPVTGTSCNSGYYYSGGACYSCTGISFTYDSNIEYADQQTDTPDCTTEYIANGTRTHCRYRYRTPYRSYTTTCYHDSGAGGTSGPEYCTGAYNCTTTYGDYVYPDWSGYSDWGEWTYSCNPGYQQYGETCICSTPCSSIANNVSTTSGSDSCSILNGWGSYEYTNTCNGTYTDGCYSADAYSCTGCTSWERTYNGACILGGCNDGYYSYANACYCSTDCTAVSNITDVQECTPTNAVANAYGTYCPVGTQTCNGTYTTGGCSSAGAICSGCSSYGACTTSCYATSCNEGYYLSGGACYACEAGYTSAAGNTGGPESCYRACTVGCVQPGCPSNATCDYGSADAYGIEYYGGYCNASANYCPITVNCNNGYTQLSDNSCSCTTPCISAPNTTDSQGCTITCDKPACPLNATCEYTDEYGTGYQTCASNYTTGICYSAGDVCSGCDAWGACIGSCNASISAISCNSGFYYSSGACYACTDISFVSETGTDYASVESEQECATEEIVNGTRTHCHSRYRTPYRSSTTTCYRTGGAGGTYGPEYCSGETSCSTSYGEYAYPEWSAYDPWGEWTYSCNPGYQQDGETCICSTPCSSILNSVSTESGSAACSILNGLGSQTYINTCNGNYIEGCYSADASSCTGCTSWGRTSTGECTVTGCNDGYFASSNACYCTTDCSAVPNTDTTQECTPINDVANAKTKICPQGIQTCAGNYTEGGCYSGGAQCSGCSLFGACNNACYAESCNTGFYLIDGACYQCESGYTSIDGNTGDISSCFKSCSVACYAPTCPDNATCSYSANDAYGTEYYGAACDAVANACPMAITCNPGFYLSEGQCLPCGAGYYCSGNNVQTPCPEVFPYSDGGAAAITSCYSGPITRAWDGQQIGPELPSGCTSISVNECSNPECTYTMYSNADATAPGLFRDGCDSNNDPCYQTIASVTPGIGFYAYGLTCPACTNKPANSTYIGDGGAYDNCPWNCDAGYIQYDNRCIALCDAGYYRPTADSECTACPNGYYCPGDDNSNEAIACPADTTDWNGLLVECGYHPLAAIQTYLSSWSGATSDAAYHISQCFAISNGIGLQEGALHLEQSYDPQRQDYWHGCDKLHYFYSANTGYYLSDYYATTFNTWYNQIKQCTNAPENAYYTAAGTPDGNNCPWACNAGYNQTFQSQCAQICTAGVSTLHAGEKVTVSLYNNKITTPSIVIQNNDQMCYVNLVPGQATGALNVEYQGVIYHTSN